MGILQYGNLLTAVCPYRPQAKKCNSQPPERVIPPWTVAFLSLISNQAVPIQLPGDGSQKSWVSQSSQLASLIKSLGVKHTRAGSLHWALTQSGLCCFCPASTPPGGAGISLLSTNHLPDRSLQAQSNCTCCNGGLGTPAAIKITPRITLPSPAAAARTHKGQHPWYPGKEHRWWHH